MNNPNRITPRKLDMSEIHIEHGSNLNNPSNNPSNNPDSPDSPGNPTISDNSNKHKQNKKKKKKKTKERQTQPYDGNIKLIIKDYKSGATRV